MAVANPSLKSRANADEPADFGVLIFAKAPRAGLCKTRLARTCGTRRAARLYRAMLEHVVASIHRQTAGEITLVCSPDPRHPFLVALVRRYGVGVIRQTRGDLGQRMHHAVVWGLRRYRRVVLVGSDQPALADRWPRAARAALDQNDRAWLAPSKDGGYWAIGLARAEARVFRGPRWSTARVSVMTRQRLDALAFRRSELDARRDIDTWRDWQRAGVDVRRNLARRAAMPAIRWSLG